MKSRNVLRIVLGVVIGGALLAMVMTKQVRFTETAVIETFGRPADKTLAPGLHLRWPMPIQDVIAYDTRIQRFDTPYEQIQIAGDKNVMLCMYVCWQLEDPLLFRRSVGKNLSDVEGKLRDVVRTKVAEVVGGHRIEAFASMSRDSVKLADIERDILERVRDQVRRDYGVAVLQVRIKRSGLPEQVTPTVMESMRAERMRKAQDDRSQGEARAQAIQANAKATAESILSFARAQAAEIEGRGMEEAAAYYGQYGQHQGFAMFLQRLRFLSETLKDGLFVLDGSQYDESFGYFRQPPTARGVEGKAPAVPAGAAKP